jgi:hypothetical protein
MFTLFVGLSALMPTTRIREINKTSKITRQQATIASEIKEPPLEAAPNVEARPGIEPGCETVPRPCVDTIPPPGRIQLTARRDPSND